MFLPKIPGHDERQHFRLGYDLLVAPQIFEHAYHALWEPSAETFENLRLEI